MQVLLLQDVDNLGLAGDVAKVAPGYGRNYLLPQKMAILATEGALKQSDAIRKSGELRRAQEKADAEAIVGQIEGQELVFERRAGERGQLYGSVTSGDITDAIQEKLGIEVDKRKIRLSEPIRALGDYEVSIRLMVEVTTSIYVGVITEGDVYIPLNERPDPNEVEAEDSAEGEGGDEVQAEAADASEETADAVEAEATETPVEAEVADDAVAEADTTE